MTLKIYPQINGFVAYISPTHWYRVIREYNPAAFDPERAGLEPVVDLDLDLDKYIEKLVPDKHEAFDTEPMAIAYRAVVKYTELVNERKQQLVYDSILAGSLHITWFSSYFEGNWRAVVMWDGHDERFEVTYTSKDRRVIVKSHITDNDWHFFDVNDLKGDSNNA